MTFLESFINGAGATIGVITIIGVFLFIEKYICTPLPKKNYNQLKAKIDFSEDDTILEYFNNIKQTLENIEKNTNSSPI